MKLARYSLLLFLTLGVGFASKAQSISSPTVIGTSFCAGDLMNINHGACTGPYNGGNQFIYELSDGTGDFSNSDTLATVSTATCPAGPAGLVLPEDLPLGSNYRVRILATDPATVGTASASFTILPLPNVTITVLNPTAPGTNVACVGDSVRLTAVFSLGNTYQWKRNGGPIAAADGGDNDTIWIVDDGGVSTGIYTIEVDNGLCTHETPIGEFIQFYTPPTTVISTNQTPVGPHLYEICFGDSVVLQAPTPIAPNVFFYEWQIDTNGTFMTIPTATNSSYRAVISGDYQVIVTDTLCTDTSVVDIVVVDSFPNASVVNNLPTILCLGDSTILSAIDTVAGWRYQWQIDSVGVPGGFKNIALADGGEDPFIQLDTTLLQPPVGSASITTNIRLIVSNASCRDTSIIIPIQMFGPPNIRIVDGTGAAVDTVSRCFGDSALVVATGGLSYIWNGGVSFNANITLTTPGLYTVEGTGPNGCTNTASVFFEFNNPTVDAGSDQTINPGGSAQLGATTTADNPTYFWIPTNTVTNFASPSPIAQPSETTTYIVAMTDANGCTAYDTVVVNVVADPNLSVSIMNLISPNADGLNDVWDISGIVGGERGDLVIMNRWGSEVYSDPAYNNNWGGTNDGGDELPDGTYYYVLKLPSGTELTGAITIIR